MSLGSWTSSLWRSDWYGQHNQEAVRQQCWKYYPVLSSFEKEVLLAAFKCACCCLVIACMGSGLGAQWRLLEVGAPATQDTVKPLTRCIMKNCKKLTPEMASARIMALLGAGARMEANTVLHHVPSL
jgi:hypothetical protein